MSATTTQLLSSGEFCKLRYDTIPVKSASANVFSIPITQKRQILSCDFLVANERYDKRYTESAISGSMSAYCIKSRISKHIPENMHRWLSEIFTL